MRNSEKEITLIKLGGSVITDKNTPYKARISVIRRLAREIKDSKLMPLVLAHGSGSFGHTSAQKYGGKKDYKSKWGIAKVARDAMEINRIVMDILIDEGLPAVSLRPMSMMITTSGKVKKSFFEAVGEVIKQGLMPVIYGDVIWDTKWKSTIYSGETTLSEIGIYLKRKGFGVSRIIQVGQTNGVYDKKGKTIPSINKNGWKKIKQYLIKDKTIDVTGGMEHKIKNALYMAEKGIKTWILNGLAQNELLKALQNKRVVSTLVS